MSVKVKLSKIIDRPVTEVFDFFARQHVRNHPRWDPDMHLEQVTDGPIGVGTLIRRQHTRTGTLVEGTMEIVEFIPDQAFGSVIHDGPIEMRGRVTFDATSAQQTTLTFNVEIANLDESMKDQLTHGMQRSLQNIKNLVESGQAAQ